jgi:hypothetical protein
MRGEMCLWTIKRYKQQRRRLYLLNTLHTLQLQGLSVRPPCRFPTMQPADSCLDCTRYHGGREVAALAWVGAVALSCLSIYSYTIYFVFRLWRWRFLPSRADSDLRVARLALNVCVVRIQCLGCSSVRQAGTKALELLWYAAPRHVHCCLIQDTFLYLKKSVNWLGVLQLLFRGAPEFWDVKIRVPYEKLIKYELIFLLLPVPV